VPNIYGARDFVSTDFKAQAEEMIARANDATDTAIQAEYFELAKALFAKASNKAESVSSQAKLDAMAENMLRNSKGFL
jgi:hypothetical protein